MVAYKKTDDRFYKFANSVRDDFKMFMFAANHRLVLVKIMQKVDDDEIFLEIFRTLVTENDDMLLVKNGLMDMIDEWLINDSKIPFSMFYSLNKSTAKERFDTMMKPYTDRK